MPRLSKEEWAIAFYEVMKEAPPVTPKHLRSVQDKLGQQKSETEKRLKGAKQTEELSRSITEDRANKRDRAYSEYTKTRSNFDKDNLDHASKSLERASEEEVTAYTNRKQIEGHLGRVNDQIKDVETRLQKNDFDGMDDELTQAVRQEQLRDRLKTIGYQIEDAEQKLQRHREDSPNPFALEGAKKDYEERGKDYRDRLNELLKQQKQIELLMQGFDDKPITEDQAKGLEEKLGQAKQAAEDVARKIGERKQDVENKQNGVADKLGDLLKVAGDDPSLKVAVETWAKVRKEQEEATDAVRKTKDKLKLDQEKHLALKGTVDDYISGKTPVQGDGLDKALEALDASIGEISTGKSTLRGEEKTLRERIKRFETAQAELRRAIEERAEAQPPNPALKSALSALQAAEAELRRAQSALAQSVQEGDQLQGIVKDAERGLAVAKTLPEARKASEEFAEALKGYEDTPIWDGAPQLKAKMGDEKFDKLQSAANKLINQYEKLVENGASIDELRSVYDKVPELWRPPRFREQERNWVSVGGLMNEEVEDKYRKENETRLAEVDKKIETFKSKLETGESIGSKLASALGGLEKGGESVEVLKQISEKLSSVKEFAEGAEKVLGLAAKLASAVQAPIKAIDTAQQSMETQDPVEAMMLQDEFMESLGKLVEGLTGSVEGADKLKIGGALVKGLADLLPGIGVATNAASAMKLMVDSAARIQESIEDANSHEEAVQTGHRGETAIDQFARRDKHLAARAVTGTGIAIIKTAASGVDLTGVGVVAGTAMKGVATGVQGVQSVAEFVIDRQEGEKAEALLQRAQAGDGNARAELFRFHPRYAKGLLAVMANEGDALALRVLSTHGLSEDIIKRSSPKIIKRYLMKKFGETDEPPSWSSLKKSFDDGVEWLAGKVNAIDKFFDNLAIRLIARTDGDPLVAAQAKLDEALLDLPRQEVSTAATTLLQLRARRDVLAEQASGEQTKDVEAAELAVADEEKKFGTLRTKVSDSLKNVRAVMATIGQQGASALRNKAEAAAKSVVQQHLDVLEQLGRVA